MEADSEKIIRILIVDEGLHQGEIITSSLRASGLQVLAEHAEEENDLVEIVAHKPIDLVLCSMDLAELTLHQVRHLIQECGRHVIIIGIADEVNEAMQVDAMKTGAQDVVSKNALQHLALVVRREFDNLKIWRDAATNEKELHESDRRCQSLLANSKDAVAYVHEGMHIYANEPYLELFGQSDFDDIEGVPIIDMVAPDQQEELKHFLRSLSQNQNTKNQLELKLVHESGELIDGVLEFSRASFDGEPCTQILIRSGSDTSELEEQINYLHQHDLVTGLYNRQYFSEVLREYMEDAITNGNQSVLLYIVIDNFQKIRNTVGISGCDILINDIATIFKSSASEREVVSRFGADSYTVLCRGKKRGDVEQDTEQLLKQVEQNISEIGNQSISATCSIAIYYIDENCPKNPNEVLARAERTLDKIQVQGGNQMQAYVPVAGEMTQEEEDANIAQQIKTAITSNRIRTFYQPIVRITGASNERYEISRALLDEDRGELHEQDFIAAAERTGMARALDRWTIAHAITLISDALKAGRTLDLLIPLSAGSLTDPELSRWLAEKIQESKIPAKRLIFSVSEANVVSQLKQAKTLFKGLTQLHCQMVLDDFGNGGNPFQLVKHIPTDYLRLDPAFVSGLVGNAENQASIRAITEQATEMNINCIVPAVTDASVLTSLWGVGADFVQGDFLQPPSKDMNYDFSSMGS